MNFLPDELQYVLPELERRRIRGVHAGLLLLFTRVTCLSHVISGHVTRISLCSPRTFAILLRGGRGNGRICGISGSVLDERNKFVGHSLFSGRNVRWPRRMLPLVSQGEYVDETDRRTDERRAVTLRFPMWTRPVLDVHKVSALGVQSRPNPRPRRMNERTNATRCHTATQRTRCKWTFNRRHRLTAERSRSQNLFVFLWFGLCFRVVVTPR